VLRGGLVRGKEVSNPIDSAYNKDTKLRREEEGVREVRTPIYIWFRSRVVLAGLYGAVRGNARLSKGHVTARAVIEFIYTLT
jgi:hypothetical protein